jgi:hypothetical protein
MPTLAAEATAAYERDINDTEQAVSGAVARATCAQESIVHRVPCDAAAACEGETVEMKGQARLTDVYEVGRSGHQARVRAAARWEAPCQSAGRQTRTPTGHRTGTGTGGTGASLEGPPA